MTAFSLILYFCTISCQDYHKKLGSVALWKCDMSLSLEVNLKISDVVVQSYYSDKIQKQAHKRKVKKKTTERKSISSAKRKPKTSSKYATLVTLFKSMLSKCFPTIYDYIQLHDQ